MAIDRWLLAQHQLGLCPSTLRFYTWSSPTISLGYHQHQWPADWARMTWHDRPLDLVRRPTGGRAVLHQGDLTYAVITSGLCGHRQQMYQQLCEFLIEGWRSLGVNLQYGQRGRHYQHQPNCFATATGADLVLADGTKFVGSAQLHRHGYLLQHGSMCLHPDPDLFAQVFGEQMEPRNRTLTRVQTLDRANITQALTQAASQCFGVKFDIQPLSATEWQAIQQVPELTLGPQSAAQSPAVP
jgi:lipoate---protein ligase